MKPKPFHWQTPDGLRLSAQYQTPIQPKALIALIHGLGEHSRRYDYVVQALLNAGYAVSQFDLRGHGQSEGQRGHAPAYEVLLDDIEQFLKHSQTRCPDKPLFLYGHSLGGNLVLNYVLRRQPKLQGVIVSGPSLRIAFKPPAWKVAIGRLMYSLLPKISLFNEINPAYLSRDRQVVQAYLDDPLIHKQITARLGIDVLDSGFWALEHAAEFDLPLLLMHGTADQITDAQASRDFAEKAGACCTLKLWDGLYHELHQEPERDQVLRFMINWLEQQLNPVEKK